MTSTCPGCQKEFPNPRSVGAHRRHCQEYQDAPTALLKKRRRDFDQLREAKRQRREAREQAVKENIPSAVDFVESLPPEPLQEPLPEYLPSGHPYRTRRLPKCYRDELPPIPLPPVINATELTPPPTDVFTDALNTNGLPAIFETQPDDYGVYRQYSYSLPSYTPNEYASFSDLCNSPNALGNESTTEKPGWLSAFTSSTHTTTEKNPFSPFLNATTFRLMSWFGSGSNVKSISELDRLVKDVILADDFKKGDLDKFSATREAARLDSYQDKESPIFSPADGWIERSVQIPVPAERVKHTSEETAPVFEVPGLYHRSLVGVVKSAFQEPVAAKYHIAPFKEFWRPTKDDPPERVYSKVYSGDTAIAEHEKIRSQPRPCTLETVVATIMLWSDSTQLANFGTASLWPIYLFIGNLSKYTRCKPTSFAAHHLAYIPKLCDTFQDFYQNNFGMAASSAVLTHCRRQLMHAIWLLLLDEDFRNAYVYGIVLQFADGISRRVFLRFLTYAADYPEKILIACIKYFANCPCPRCVILKTAIAALGTKLDILHRQTLRRIDDEIRQGKIERVRRWIYERGMALRSKRIEEYLGAGSLVPIRNAFSLRLSTFGFNFHSMLVPDLLHEFELGVWKAIFTHLICILYAYGGNAILDLNKRYRQIPTFGRGTIRRFSRNASGMKKLAARDFEDLLQASFHPPTLFNCAIPAFEDLLPNPYNNIVLTLLFELATWHALAKLRLHTDTTLGFLETSTTRLGKALRHFDVGVCSDFHTVELPQEETARRRRMAKADPKGKQKPEESQKKKKCLNLTTYKLHALGDYADTIRQYGTSDNYSTQTGELEHKKVKRYYVRTNKINPTAGIAKLQRREQLLVKMNEKCQSHQRSTKSKDQDLPPTTPDVHHHMSVSTKDHCDISTWIADHSDDPAYTNFIPRLKDHLLARLQAHSYEGDEVEFTPEQRRQIQFINNRIYHHKALRINYTTYDMRRDDDTINPRTHSDIMVLSHEDEETDPHPYWYARVVGIFHVFIQHIDPTTHFGKSQRMDVLWVRWFGRNLGLKSGWAAKRLHQVGFLDSSNSDALGFLDPQEVIRTVHLIPSFAHGQTSVLLGPSDIRQPCEEDGDWVYYYVNMFADRDMFMRFRGGAIGHKSTRHETQCLFGDRDPLDDNSTPNTEDESAEVQVDTEGRADGNETRSSGDTDSDEESERDEESEGDSNSDSSSEDGMEGYGEL